MIHVLTYDKYVLAVSFSSAKMRRRALHNLHHLRRDLNLNECRWRPWRNRSNVEELHYKAPATGEMVPSGYVLTTIPVELNE